jgi:acetylornithine deacetylase/succinyl-diaminopimelate desuccinylase-like protein
MAAENTVAPAQAGAEAVELLGELIRIDTSNPPGNEQPAQELLEAKLSAAGFDCELIAARPGRPNLIANLPGDADGPTLCLLGHSDTVPANPTEWSFDPWAGDVVDGMVRGRGAQDMKDQVAAEVAGSAALARDGWRPARGQLRIVITADEEVGTEVGAAWLCEEHPEKVRADMFVNEGGGAAFELAGRRFYPLAVGEKGICRFELSARGVAGHASVPGIGENALLKLAPALVRLREQPPVDPTPEAVRLLATLLDDNQPEQDAVWLEGAIERLRGISPPLAAYLAEPMSRVTVVPTRVHASDKENVIPSRAETIVDCRVPPGMGPEQVRERVAGLLGPLFGEVELEFGETVVGNSSPFDSPLADVIAAWLAEADPGATLVPMVMPGFSDSHWFRKAFGSAIVYGFHPQRELDLFAAAPLVHAADERAAVADVELAAGFYADLAQRVLQ